MLDSIPRDHERPLFEVLVFMLVLVHVVLVLKSGNEQEQQMTSTPWRRTCKVQQTHDVVIDRRLTCLDLCFICDDWRLRLRLRHKRDEKIAVVSRLTVLGSLMYRSWQLTSRSWFYLVSWSWRPNILYSTRSIDIIVLSDVGRQRWTGDVSAHCARPLKRCTVNDLQRPGRQQNSRANNPARSNNARRPPFQRRRRRCAPNKYPTAIGRIYGVTWWLGLRRRRNAEVRRLLAVWMHHALCYANKRMDGPDMQLQARLCLESEYLPIWPRQIIRS